MSIRVEFTVEPFDPGRPGPHVAAAIAAAESVAGVGVDVGPFGTAVTGHNAAALSAMQGAITAALAAGASRISVQVEVLDIGTSSGGR